MDSCFNSPRRGRKKPTASFVTTYQSTLKGAAAGKMVPDDDDVAEQLLKSQRNKLQSPTMHHCCWAVRVAKEQSKADRNSPERGQTADCRGVERR